MADILADPKHKERLKTEPDNVLLDGTKTRRGVSLRYCGELWAELEPDAKEVYLTAGKEALRAHHLKFGKPTRGDTEDEDDDDGEGSEGRSSGSRSGSAGRKRKHVDMATISPVDDAPVKHFKHGNKWLLVLGSGKVLPTSIRRCNTPRTRARAPSDGDRSASSMWRHSRRRPGAHERCRQRSVWCRVVECG